MTKLNRSLSATPSGPALVRRLAPIVAAAAVITGCEGNPGAPIYYDSGVDAAMTVADAGILDAGPAPSDGGTEDASAGEDAGPVTTDDAGR